MSYFSLILGKYNFTEARKVFNETESYEKGFAEHYKNNIRSHVEEFEKSRQESLKSTRKRMFLAIPVAVLLIIAPFLVSKLQFELILFAWVAGGAALWTWVNYSIRSYQDDIKSRIFPNIVGFYDGFTYDPYCEYSMDSFARSGIVPSFDREQNEDHIRGTYKDVNIDLFESHLEVEQKSNKQTTYKTVFNGLVIKLSLNKKFKSRTIIRKGSAAVLSWFAEKFTVEKRVKLEDPVFEKMFDVYSSDQVEARYLLTTAFMDRLIELTKSLNAEEVEASFYDDSLFMMITVSENLFEPGSIFEPEDFVDDAKALLKDLQIIFEIINTLKLDLKI